ncbi:MAG: hypothetical protein HYZ13_15385 [Acidobacteria bacterium]|nr:hypothetical protein [Acidobacteriota bacterium]
MSLRLMWMLAWISSVGLAQVFPKEEPRPIYWSSNELVAYEPLAHAFVMKGFKDGSVKAQIDLGSDSKPAGFSDGVYWAVNKLSSTKPADKPIKRILSTRDGKEWKLEGWIPLTEDIDVDLIQPLGGDRFLLMAFTRIRIGERYSRFALATRDGEKRLVPDRLLDMGLEKPWGIPRTEGSLAGHFGVNPAYNELFIGGYSILRSGTFLAVVSLRAGYVWLLDAGREHPTLELVRVHSGVKDAFLAGEPHLEHCVLDAHPTSDGRFLFATRSERAVIFGAMHHPKPVDITSMKDPIFKTDRAVAQILSLRDEPDLEWYELDPMAKTFKSVPSPPGVPERLVKPEEIKGFRFWFTSKGHVACTLSTYVPGEPVAVPGAKKAVKGPR